MVSKTWMKIWFANVVAIISVIGIVNFTVDSSGVFGNNKNEVVDINNFYLIKARWVSKGNVDTLMLGTSRTGVMDVSVVNKYLKGNVYDLSAPGSTAKVQHELLLYALRYNNIRNIIYGIDFFSFNENLTDSDYDNRVYSMLENINNPFWDLSLIFNRVDFSDNLVFIFQSLIGQVKNIQRLDSLVPSTGNIILRSREYKVQNGIESIETMSSKEINSYFMSGGLNSDYRFSYKHLEFFRESIEYCLNNDINVYIYIPPVFSDHFDAINSAGYFDEFELFKKEISKIHSFIDFTGHNKVTENKDYFLDSSHLKKSATPMVINRLLNDKNISPLGDFGVLVSKDNINQHLISLRKQIKPFRSFH